MIVSTCTHLCLFSFRGKGRKEEEEETEASVQHIHGSHEVDGAEVHWIIIFQMLYFLSVDFLETVELGLSV